MFSLMGALHYEANKDIELSGQIVRKYHSTILLKKTGWMFNIDREKIQVNMKKAVLQLIKMYFDI